ncbi:MAG TPA: BlaI/MecI/CopY family transcriptional regulator [Candidatus Anaerofilum excrementigallinarum]|nr:BlaI/MecI/CopY family transcriptional regulator [Candidatus Anaerofilum excrementigallinarum]
MEATKLFDAEWNLMCFVWANQPSTASQAAAYALKAFNWKKNTTYTVIKRLVEKKILRRDEPGFVITPLVQKDEVQRAEATWVLNNRFDGDVNALRETLRAAGYQL